MRRAVAARKERAPEKVLIIVVEPDEETRGSRRGNAGTTRPKSGSPRISGLGLLLISAACRSKAGGACSGSFACRQVRYVKGGGDGTCGWVGVG